MFSISQAEVGGDKITMIGALISGLMGILVNGLIAYLLFMVAPWLMWVWLALWGLGILVALGSVLAG